MDLQTVFVILVFLSQIAIGFMIFLLWQKVKARQNTGSEAENRQREELQTLTNRVMSKVDIVGDRLSSKVESLMSLVNVQHSLISLISGNPEVIRRSGVKTEELDQNRVEESDPVKITPRVRNDGFDRHLEQLLNGSEFLENFWQNTMYKAFDECQNALIRFLVENGQPEPLIEIYPPLQDDNPNHWQFIIVQIRGAAADKKRYIIPRHYDRFDPLWHSHLFDVRGGGNKPENFVTRLHRCAMISSDKELSGYIDKTLVEKKGIISLT